MLPESQPLHRYGLGQASSELGIHIATLRKALKSRGIEPSGPGGFTLAELVRAMAPAEESAKEQSLRATAALSTHRAAMVQLELAREEGRLIPREAALQFLRAVVKSLYAEILWHPELSRAQQDKLIRRLYTVATEQWLREGWTLEPELTFSRNGDKPVRSRREEWASKLCDWLWEKEQEKQRANKH